MLIKTEKEELSQIIKRIGSRYVYWYNSKYNRTGHLFQDRYKSQPIEDDSYFLATLRYIHQNPLKAGLCKKLSDYEWSSYKDYCNKKGITDTSFALDLLGKYFFKFMREESNDKCLEIEAPKPKLTDSELYKKICQELKVDPLKIASETRNKRNELLRRILAFEGVSTRQISRVTGVSANIICKQGDGSSAWLLQARGHKQGDGSSAWLLQARGHKQGDGSFAWLLKQGTVPFLAINLKLC